MKYPDYVDAEMRELLDTLGKLVVPRSKRKPVEITRWSVPHYSRGRYVRI